MEEANWYDFSNILYESTLLTYIKKNLVAFQDKLKAVDTWQLWERAREEKLQSEKEMKQHLTCLDRDIVSLEAKRAELISLDKELSPDIGFNMNSATLLNEMLDLNRSIQKICRQKAVLVSQALEKLRYQQAEALSLYRQDPTLGTITDPSSGFDSVIEADYSEESESDDSDEEDVLSYESQAESAPE
jgi:hypothetical protein